MRIERLTDGERNIYVLQNAGIYTNFTHFSLNTTLGSVELYNRNTYLGYVSHMQAPAFRDAFKAVALKRVA